ncbi:BaiN/RdsA family NAD(P)/FAD-dependent oxidoreductase [Acidomonas methanolica]|uniref:NAD(P)/FAD-dependent oxidoreductase n=1 Tax=Acidomonas methanolica TaxID=437 RepID=UPI00211A9E41|nr:aminoacetone oxidase family FAD-binding enzyme [Acidomonas methanolica]
MGGAERPWDVAVLGAGAAGLMAAAVAGRRGASVLVLDNAAEAGRKILISGGGRCNFTHLDAGPERFLSRNPHFARSALARYTPRDFLALVEKHRIAWHEKTPGQLFCDESARRIVALLLDEAQAAGAALRLRVRVNDIERGEAFRLVTDHGDVLARRVILATGGLAVPKLGATDFALRMAQRFGMRVVPPAPALVPLTLASPAPDLAGVALPVAARIGKTVFSDAMVFTHRGISGPAILQISSYRSGDAPPLELDLLPGLSAEAEMRRIKQARPRAGAAALLEGIPQRLGRAIAAEILPDFTDHLANLPDRRIAALARRVSAWSPDISGTEGYAKAEVMRGGIDTRDLSSQTMESRLVPGLYAIGEAVDVTGWLGGYNFQWAWSSGYVAGIGAAS